MNNDILNKYGISVDSIKNEVSNSLKSINSLEEVTNLYRKYLGKDGVITEYLKKVKDIEEIDRREYGIEVNKLKNEIDELINEKKLQLENSNNKDYESLELENTLPKLGHLHPLTQTIREMNEIFEKMGYSVMDGPEIDSDEYVFQRMNVPLDHPARDLQDSIYLEEPNVLLRTQTSSIEARVLEKFKPPFKAVVPGRVFRNEKVNKSNHFQFHQYQMFCVKEEVSLSELASTIKHLFNEFLGDDLPIRFRNKYYPEVEPGMGADRMCFVCKGTGKDNDTNCGVCKGRGWREMGGAGIIHPIVLEKAGIDPKKFQGFAFGLGLDRWAMERHNIKDIRSLLGGYITYKPNVS